MDNRVKPVVERELHLDRGFQARLRAVYLDRDVQCPKCRYELRGVPGPRCPECGLVVAEVLRIADTTGWRLRRERARWLARRMVGWGLFTILAVIGTLAGALTLGWL